MPPFLLFLWGRECLDPFSGDKFYRFATGHHQSGLSAAAPTFHLHGIVILIMAVLSVVAIRFGYKALLIEWAIDAISKAEKEFVGTKLGEARLAVVVSWLREKVPAPIRFLVTDDLIRKAVQTSFNAAKSGLEVLKNA